MVQLSLNNMSKSYGKIVAVEQIDLDVHDGEFLVLLGPSGCGKSTTLRMIAGLEGITGGDLYIGDKRVNDIDPKDRGVAMVFQNYALYPHKSVFDNMAMSLKIQGIEKSEVERRVNDVAQMLSLTEYLERKPAALSGGQRQRVAIGRAIVRTPDVFLFDEPLSNLDAKLRVKMRMELQEMHARLGVTTIYVTHDQVEAMTLADRIVIMNNGVVAQVGTPREVYETPATEFVASFIGSPSMNFIRATKTSKNKWQSNSSMFTLPDPKGFDTKGHSSLSFGIRPEHLQISKSGTDDKNPWIYQAQVTLAELLGADALLNLSINGETLLARVNGKDHPLVGDKVSVRIPVEELHVFDPKTTKALAR